MFGSPLRYKLHMDGLEVMINMRGGLDQIEAENPKLYGLINL
jgi:hypothetical protein